jgi:hypothetical protein
MPWYSSDMSTLKRMAIPLDKTRLRNPLRRGQPKRTSHGALSLIKRLFYNGPCKAWKYHRMTEPHSVANHKRRFIGSLLSRRRSPPYKKFSSPLLFTWSRPDFCDFDINYASPLDLPDLSWKHNGDALEPFVQPSVPEPFASSILHGSAWQRFSSFYGQIDPSIQSLINRKRGKCTRARTFTPLPAIKEEDDNSLSSQIYQPVSIRISRDISPIEEEDEEENEPPQRDYDFNLLPGQSEPLYLSNQIYYEKISIPGPLETPIIIASDDEDEIYEEGNNDFHDFFSPAIGGSLNRKQCELESLNWSSRFNYCEDISFSEYQIPQCWYDADDSSSSLESDSSDSS